VDIRRERFPETTARIPYGGPGTGVSEEQSMRLVGGKRVKSWAGTEYTPRELTLFDAVEDLLKAERSPKGEKQQANPTSKK
jgi:hypothetical protein